jgi:hypothetical protein
MAWVDSVGFVVVAVLCCPLDETLLASLIQVPTGKSIETSQVTVDRVPCAGGAQQMARSSMHYNAATGTERRKRPGMPGQPLE